MIISQIFGGLGNQLFQYAAGRALAVRHGTTLRLDTSAFRQYKLRSYDLRHFRIEASEMSVPELEALGLGVAKPGRLAHLARRLLGSPKVPVIKERGFGFDSRLLDAPDTCYLEGYWQSPRYFNSVAARIRSELGVREPLAGRNLEIARQMTHHTAVSLHVRRGDYVSNAHTSRYHGTCGPEYYAAAETLLQARVGEMHLYVFSDEPDWAEANLHFLSSATIVRHNGPEQGHEDLRLMSLCRHHIVANSTFSWWGAWLCNHADKLVVAPRNWFAEANLSAADLIPDDWIRV